MFSARWANISHRKDILVIFFVTYRTDMLIYFFIVSGFTSRYRILQIFNQTWELNRGLLQDFPT